MTGKVALGGICAGLTLLIALQAEDDVTRATAAFACSCFVSFTATTVVIETYRQQKNRELQARNHIQLMHLQERSRLEAPRPKACIGCQHYHGRIYGGHLLVCAMHPSGVEEDYCVDWEVEGVGDEEMRR